MEKALRELIQSSRTVGADPMLVQGGGGNTSVKTDDGRYMYVKASGTSLKSMDEKKGWRKVDLAKVRADLDDPSLARMAEHPREAEILKRLLSACCDGKADGGRPSVESHVHALLETHVVHVHAMLIGAYVNAKKGQAALMKRLSKRALPPLWIPYCNPGYGLAVKAHKAILSYKKKYGRAPEIVLQGKHGIFASAPTRARVLAVVREVVESCRLGLKWRAPKAGVKPPPAQVRKTADALQGPIWNALGQDYLVSPVWHPVVADFLAQKDLAKLVTIPALTPDELIYTHGRLVLLDSPNLKVVERALVAGSRPGQKPPLLYLVKGQGLFVASKDSMKQAVVDTALMGMSVRRWARGLGGAMGLNTKERAFILSWEVENYRAKVAAGK